jgi:hypothetical protein
MIDSKQTTEARIRVKPETAKRFAAHCKAINKSQSSTFADCVDLLANDQVRDGE